MITGGAAMKQGKKRAILHFASYYAPYRGNFISSLARLAAFFACDGIETVYVFPAEAKELAWAQEMLQNGEAVYFLADSPGKSVKLLRDTIERHNVVAVHTHFSETRYNLLIKRALYGKKIKWIRHVHSAYRYAGALKEPLKRFAEPCDCVITCNDKIAEDMALHGYSRQMLCPVYNGVDFTRLDTYETLTHAQLGITADTQLVMMFGYNTQIKGVDLAVEAVKCLRETCDICLMLVAASNIERVKADIAAQCGGNLPPWILLLPPRDDIASYYHAADIFLSASRTESFCYALLEAQYCECYAVASKIPGHMRVASMFESEDAAALANALAGAINMNADEREAVLQQQKKAVMEQHSVDRWARQVRQVYRDKLGI